MKFNLVIFGITGNLAQIKLIPALYDLAENNLLPEDFSIIGVARKSMSKPDFDEYFHEVLNRENRHHNHEIKKETHDQLCSRADYIDGDFNDPKLYSKLSQVLEASNKMFYLATYPDLYKNIFDNLKSSGLTNQDSSWSRVIVEKPLGNDLASAKKLNTLFLEYFEEDQIYRLDHYLGKETMQNIINFRFGNGIFEPMINKDYVDHIQITAAEDFGIGKRGGYYDKVGALKDVGQNHLLQMLALSTMDDPKHFTNEDVTRARMAIIKSLKPMPDKVIFGQYDGYIDEENVDKESNADTFFAFKTLIDNQRFADIPVYIRGGKKLARTVTEVSIVFKLPVNRIFSDIDCGMEHNVLVYRIQPNEGIVLKILAKAPGHNKKIVPSHMQFCYKQLEGIPADPYEKLINDALKGDQTFFNDAPEVEAQWEFIDPLCDVRGKPYKYDQGSWGPKEADDLIGEDGREWIEPSTSFCQF